MSVKKGKRVIEYGEQILVPDISQGISPNKFIKSYHLHFQTFVGICVIAVLLALPFFVTIQESSDKLVVLISINGFRADYFELYRNETRFVQKLASGGVQATYLRPVFPTESLPNLYTIITGLYPQHHGIVDNIFFDPELNSTFVYTDPTVASDSKWYGGEPIWVTLQKQGLHSASMFWPGSNAPIQGVYPTYYSSNKTLSFVDRINLVMDWLKNPTRPNLLILYFDEISQQAEESGPYALENTINEIDLTIESLVYKIQDMKIDANYIIVSDHGISAVNVSASNTIYLDSCLDMKSITITTLSPNAGIISTSNLINEVYTNLSTCHPHLKVYYKQSRKFR